VKHKTEIAIQVTTLLIYPLFSRGMYEVSN